MKASIVGAGDRLLSQLPTAQPEAIRALPPDKQKGLLRVPPRWCSGWSRSWIWAGWVRVFYREAAGRRSAVLLFLT
jgi:hypothetical protein